MKLWLIGAGMLVAGYIVYSIFGFQLLILKKCAMKLYTAIRNEHEFWFPDACKSYLNKVRRRNTAIIIIVLVVSLIFVPLIGVLGFVLGILLARILNGARAGLTDDNVNETLRIFLRFVKPGKAEEFADLFVDVVDMLRVNERLGFR